MKPGRLLIFGASGHGKVVAEVARCLGWELLGFVDDDPAKAQTSLDGLKVVAIGRLNGVDLARRSDAAAIVAIGSNHIRAKVFEELVQAELPMATLIHPRAWVASTARIGAGSVLVAGVMVNANATVGSNVILNTGVTVDHDNILGDHCHLSPGVHTGGSVTVGEGTHLGVGVSVRNGIAIGPWSTVGVGAAVVQDLPGGIVAVGVPARVRPG